MFTLNQSRIRILALLSLPLLLQACVFGENKEYFGKADGSPSATVGDIGSVATATATPDPSSIVPVGSATPYASATPSESATPAPSPCTAGTTTQNLRILFMVDNSGSTLTTDPDHHYRVKTVQNFIDNYGSHTNLTYSFGYFNGSTAKIFDQTHHNFQAASAIPFGDASFLNSALSLYETYAPSGSTPYTASFRSLKSIVQQDEATGVKQNYVVVFMSDGMPTDIYGNVNSGIINLVDSLRTTVQSNGTSLLSVSSVYFGPENDHTSIGNLATMAHEGQGQFVDTNQLNSELKINDVITVPGSCH